LNSHSTAQAQLQDRFLLLLCAAMPIQESSGTEDGDWRTPQHTLKKCNIRKRRKENELPGIALSCLAVVSG